MSKHNPIIEYNNGSTGEFFGHGKCTISQLIFLATDFAPYGATMFRILVGRSRSLWMHISR